VARCNLLLCLLKDESAGRIKFFSDEKIFFVDAKANRRNDRWLAHDPEDVPIIARTEAAFVNMDKDALQRACRRFRPKIEAKGSYIEYNHAVWMKIVYNFCII
ncbi:hypothetical protein ALC62_09286, partial [Cyphomyrmex costatus]